MNEQKTEISQLDPMNTIAAMEGILDQLADATGRSKCGYIWVMTELIGHLKAMLFQPVQPEEIKMEVPEEKEEPKEE